jgi:lysine 2,3-aminomutase
VQDVRSGVSAAKWQDWQWQQRHRITELGELEQYVRLTEDERAACAQAVAKFRMAITPYYLSLMDPLDAACPIRLQAIPRLPELTIRDDELRDPLAEDAHEPVPGLVHRYPDRALIYTTHNCPVYCRFCFRKRKVSHPETATDPDQWRAAIAYLQRTPAIRDVLISGGDPLTLSDTRLDDLLTALRCVPHLEILRLATRNPVTLPQRIDPALCQMLARHGPIYVNTHFNHPKECTPEAAAALACMADHGLVLGNQMVLLKGINDDADTVRTLNHWLLRQRCRPYYMFQCDVAEGTAHFRVPIARGLDILRALRGWTSGLAVPHYVLDLPGGAGKVAMSPDPIVSAQDGHFEFRSYRDQRVAYQDH